MRASSAAEARSHKEVATCARRVRDESYAGGSPGTSTADAFLPPGCRTAPEGSDLIWLRIRVLLLIFLPAFCVNATHSGLTVRTTAHMLNFDELVVVFVDHLSALFTRIDFGHCPSLSLKQLLQSVQPLTIADQ